MRFFVLACVICLLCEAPAATLWTDDDLSSLTVPIDTPSGLLDAAGRTLDRMRDEVSHESSRQSRTVMKSGEFLLAGDLFKTGEVFALAQVAREDEESGGVAFAKWDGTRWVLRSLFSIPTVWRPEGWKPTEGDYLPMTPATVPFALEDLDGDGVPEVILAGGVWRYWQENYLLRFSHKAGELKILASAMAKPERVNDYVRLYFNSGHRAIYEEWQFLEWKREGLMRVASWHDEVGYNENDPTFSEGSRGDEVIRVLYGHGNEYETGEYLLTRNGDPFGNLRVVWKDEDHLPEGFDVIEKAWLFEKTTGLPRELYPGYSEEKSIPRLEDFATVKVSGNAEAAKVFEIGERKP